MSRDYYFLGVSGDYKTISIVAIRIIYLGYLCVFLGCLQRRVVLCKGTVVVDLEGFI